MNVINPPYSFIQFTSGANPDDCSYLLPMALDTDLKFQSIIGTSAQAQSTGIISEDQQLFVVKSDAVITDEASLTNNTLLDSPYVFDTIQLDTIRVLLCWGSGVQGVSTLDNNICFRLCMRITDGTTTEYFVSNCFIKISNIKFYSTLEYSCNSDNYGFRYCDGCSNKVRLPLYIGSPQIKEDQTVYIYSNGERKMTKYLGSNLYDMIIGNVPADIHNKITTALAHDNVSIESNVYSGGLRKDGDYTIGWDRPQDTEAPATTKAYATPYQVASDNCAECTDFCATISSLNASAEFEAVDCADIDQLNAEAVNGDLGGFSVVLGRTSTKLTAVVSGGIPPYHYFFYCIPEGGDCHDSTIAVPNQNTPSTSVNTNYSTIAYFGVIYKFFVDVTDSTLATASDGPNSVMNCLVPETLITMADGSTKELHEIKEGDDLMTIDIETGEAISTKATSVIRARVNKIYSILSGPILKTSAGHVNLVHDNGVMQVRTHDLRVGDELIDISLNHLVITDIIIKEGDFEVINLSTDKQTYIANSILTHNKIACP